MIGILIVTHSFLGRALVQVIEQILGPQKGIRTIDINGTFDHRFKWDAFRADIASLDQGKGVLIFTDLFGSASSNLALAGMGSYHCEVVMGVNIPMLLTAVENRHLYGLADLVDHVVEQGRYSIQTATTILEGDESETKKRSLLERSLIAEKGANHSPILLQGCEK